MTMTATRRPKSRNKASAVEKTVAAIEKLTAGLHKSGAASVKTLLKLGNQFERLHPQVADGQWEKTIKRLGYNVQSVQRLRKLAKSPVAEVVRTRGTPLLAHMAPDVQKLLMLGRLDVDQIDELLKDVDMHQVTREEMSDLVNKIANKDADGHEDEMSDTAEDGDAESDSEAEDETGDEDEEDPQDPAEETDADEADADEDAGPDADADDEEDGCGDRAEDDRFDDVHLDYSERPLLLHYLPEPGPRPDRKVRRIRPRDRRRDS